ncbi:MAG TPA: DNA-directed RNA polymerase subunit H [Candidatus Nanoarchaeia archaeon]|nr:DNA-directed RNA polymerase subunit H [Candidatus Nanoarchaeia archaeon]
MTQTEIEHSLVPKHSKLTDVEVQKVLEKFNVSLKQLPKIRAKDAAITNLEVKEGDVIKVVRKSPTAGKAIFYRVVVE